MRRSNGEAGSTRRSFRESSAPAARTEAAPTPARRKLTRKEAKAKARELDRRSREIKRESKQKKKSFKQQIADQDKNLSDEFGPARKRRARAKDVYNLIGFESMFQDGTCEVEAGLWSQTVRFSDISYQAAQDEDKKIFFENYSEIFNNCGSETVLQTSIVNTPVAKEEIGERVFFGDADPAHRRYIAEYNSVLNDKMREGRSNIMKERYITFSVAAVSYEDALPKLANVRADITRSLQKLGCTVAQIDGVERLRLISSQLRPGKRFEFDYEELYASGLTAKDYVCPMTLNFEPAEGADHCFKSDDVWCQVLAIRRFGSQVSDQAISEIVDLPIPMNIALHSQALNIGEDTDFVRERITWIDKEITDKQMKALQKGYDPDMIPQNLAYAKNDAEDLLDNLLYKNQRLFRFTGLVYTYAETFEELEEQAIAIIRAARRGSLQVELLECQQKMGLNSILPLGHNHMLHERYLTTAQISMLIPFATIEMFEETGGYYGQNKESHNLIVFNRKSLAAPMGFILGQPGSGKSFFVKREIANTRFTDPDAEVIIFDPNNEYTLETSRLGGANLVLSPNSGDHINLFDVYAGAGEATGEDPVAFKAETVLALVSEIYAAGDEGLTAQAKAVIDRCVHEVYRAFHDSPEPPVLGDFADMLRAQPEPVAGAVAEALELYTTGSLRYFNHRTTVDIDNKMVCFSFKQLGKNMRTFAMLVLLDYAYNRMLYNFDRGVTTWLYIDEAQSLFYSQPIVDYFNKFWSEGRKFNLIPTAITQTVERVLLHDEARFMLSNSGFLALFAQSANDRASLSELLNLSPQQEKYIETGINPGEGLLCLGAAKIPIEDNWPKGELYDLWNTKPEEIAELQRARWQERNRLKAQIAEERRAAEADAVQGAAGEGAGSDAEGAPGGEGRDG